jgi:hypothetical protein
MFTIKSSSLPRPTIGKPLWYKGDDIQLLGFLMAEFDSEKNGKSYLIGLIEEGRFEVVSPEHCWVADWCEAKSADLRGIICTNHVWGIGQITEQPYRGRDRWQEIVIALPRRVSDGRPITVRTTVHEVTLCCFGSR